LLINEIEELPAGYLGSLARGENEVFEDLEIQRLILGEDFHRLFSKQAMFALQAANMQNPEDWAKSGEEWARLREEIRLAAEEAFGISKICW